MLLIHPPVANPCDPPAGIARLSGALQHHGIQHTVLDANLEALRYVIDNTRPQSDRHDDTWTARSLRNTSANHNAVKDLKTYQNIDRYKRAVIDLNRTFEVWADNGAVPGIANYKHKTLSPLRSRDLLYAAGEAEKNPYYPYYKERLPALIEKNTSSFAGFSLNYLSQALCTFAMIGFLKKRFPHLSIILGGGLVTSWMKNPGWQDPFRGLIDHLVSGPGEEKLLAILGADSIEKKCSVPSYDGLPLDDYLAPGHILPYSASSGCYWQKCSFCPEKAEDNRYIPLPADTALSELHELIIKTNPALVHILDNAVSPSLLKRLAESGPGVPHGIQWYGFARIDSLLTDMDFCTELKKSGCVMLKLGLESGDQGVLDRMQKGINIETASAVLQTLKKAGIATYVYLIFGTPAETLNAAGKTLDFVVRHSSEINFLNVAMFNMPVCSPEASRYETRQFYEGDLSLYTDFIHPSGWNRKEVRLFIENEFKKNRAVSDILNNDPPLFTSNHAPFFVI
ncbi:MAG: radical SAM protein [Nitrospira bacterium SG8_35_4]|nr:MAG: radical SAM protein [Nitrospira bacterium SG8_35_4]